MTSVAALLNPPLLLIPLPWQHRDCRLRHAEGRILAPENSDRELETLIKT